jgi:hypothetical protein
MTHSPTMLHHNGRAGAAGSAAACAIADRIAAGRHELAQRIVDRCREEIADYRLVDDEEVLADVLAFALDCLDALTAGLKDGQGACAARLEPPGGGASISGYRWNRSSTPPASGRGSSGTPCSSRCAPTGATSSKRH